jgi:DNA-binding FadR family transcriptional regulator
LTQQLVEELGVAIVTGRYAGPDGFPIESEICANYGASRSVVREAIKVLNAKGLLIARPRRGTSVRPEREWNMLDPDVLFWTLERHFSLPFLLDLTRTRLAIEPAAAAEAARVATEEQIAQIGEMLNRMREANEGRLDPLETEIAFHLAILEASNNPFFYGMGPMIETALRLSTRCTGIQLRKRGASVEEYRRIYLAIKEGNGDAAVTASRGMLEGALALMENP